MTRVAADLLQRDRRVRRNLYLEGAANLAVLGAKVVVGLATGSLAILGDALHSFMDVANNIAALIVMRHATAPADRDHPYGHRKFETLAVFVLAVLLTVLAFELLIRGIGRGEREVARHGWSLAVMIGVLIVNVAIATWQGVQARRLKSDILSADARHTFADVLTTIVVIAGWQFAARGHIWIDTAAAIGVAGIVLYLAYGLFRRAIPILVDQVALDPDALRQTVGEVPGVIEVRSARSRSVGMNADVDVVVSVDAALSIADAHVIADAIEEAVKAAFPVEQIAVHVEPH